MRGDQQPIAGLERPNARFAFDLDGGRPGEKRDPLGPILLEPFRRRGGLARRNNAFDREPGRGEEIEELLVLRSLGNVDEQISGIRPSLPSVAVPPACRPTGWKRRNYGGLQAFWQAFPNLACFSPRISKESFGGFVGFQWVTRVKTQSVHPPNFSPRRPRFGRIAGAMRRVPPTRAAGRARSADSRERLRRTVAEGGFIVEHQFRLRGNFNLA